MKSQYLKFQTDKDRFKYFIDDSRMHSAKLELRTLRWVYENYTTPGMTVLDPMSGVGSVHIGTLHGLNTLGIEIHDRFYNLQKPNVNKLQKVAIEEDGLDPSTFGWWIGMHGDARRYLPIPCDFVIFSPPYGSVFQTRTYPEHDHKYLASKGLQADKGYGTETGNIGNITIYPDYLYAMKEIYRLCRESLPNGGRLCFVTKDYVRNKKRVPVTVDNIKVCMELGYKFVDCHYRVTNLSLWQNIAKQQRKDKGIDIQGLDVLYEDIIIMEK